MKKTYKRLRVVLGLLLLGIIINALWEIGIKPLFPYLRDFFLNLTSLGIQSVKDKTYLSIAKGFHEYSSLGSYIILMILYVYAIVCFSVYVIVISRRLRERTMELSREIEGIEKEQKTLNDLEEMVESMKRRSKWLVRASYLMLVVTSLGLWIVLINSFRLEYINSAITHYQQVLNICDPYLSDNNKKRVVSSFAQIRKKEHYVVIIKELEKIATEKGQYVSKFEAW